MNKILLSSFLFFTILACYVEGVKFTRCELVRELKKQKFPDLQMRTWVCIIEAESDRDTAKKTRMPDGTFRWGLFQLANPTWCTPGKAGGRCNAKCEDFLLDDITKASACATTVYKEKGFSAWGSYATKCQSNLPDISACPSFYTLLKKWFKQNKMALAN